MAKVTCTKKVAIISAIVVLLAAAGIAVGVFFGVNGSSIAGSQAVKVNVQQLSSNDDNALRRRARLSAFAMSDALPAVNGKSWALIDGLKLDLISVRFASDGGQRRDIVIDWPGRRQIEIGRAIKTEVISDSADVSKVRDAFTTQFVGLDILTAAPYRVKAWCRTKDYMVYTSSTGFKRVNWTTITDVPSDYDYLKVDSPKTWNDGKIYYNNFAPFRLGSNVTALSSLIDNSYSVVCTDGADYISTATEMDLQGLNIFIKVGTTDKLTPESYVVSPTASAINGVAIDFNNAQIVTMAYLPDGSIYGSTSSRTYSTFANGVLGLSEFQKDSAGVFTMYDGTPYGKEFRNARDRSVAGFKRPTGSEVFTTTTTDGPDCSKTLIDYNNQNAARACLGTGVSVTHYWKKLPRG